MEQLWGGEAEAVAMVGEEGQGQERGGHGSEWWRRERVLEEIAMGIRAVGVGVEKMKWSGEWFRVRRTGHMLPIISLIKGGRKGLLSG